MPDRARVLVATDLSPSARVALRSAEALARLSGGPLALVHVLEPLPPRYRLLIQSFGTPDLEEVRRDAARKALAREVTRLRGRGSRLESFVRHGRPWQEILKAAREWQADLICLGNSGRSRLDRLLLGSTAENVVCRSDLPVLVTRDRPLAKLDRVFLPVDFDEGSKSAVRFAVERLPRKSRLEALFVLPPPLPLDPYQVVLDGREKTIARDLRAFLREQGAGRTRARVLLWGDPADEILRAARRSRADLIVIATHGRRGLPRALMGSVAEKVVRYADRPVLVLPPPGRSAGQTEGHLVATGATQTALSLAKEPAARGGGRRRSPGGPAAAVRANDARRARLTAKARTGVGRSWEPHAHPGRGGPAGRRGSGHARGKGGGRPA